MDGIEESFEDINLTLVRQKNRYLGAVRNTGIQHAKGEFVLFMDDDNEAKPHEIESFLNVQAYTAADVLTCFAESFSKARPGQDDRDAKLIAFQGDNLALGLIKNPFGDSNCFVRKSFLNTLNGFTEHYKVGRDDAEFLSRSVLSGGKVVLVPEALYWYRINRKRMRHGQYSLYAGAQRVSETYIQGLHPDLANILRYAQGMTEALERPSSVKQNLPAGARRMGLFAKITKREMPVQFVEFGRRVVRRFPFLYDIALKIYRRL